MDALHALLRGSIDYAGLFPPAALDMAAAVHNYAEYRTGADAWALGRFIVPVSRLAEFETSAAELLPPRTGAGAEQPSRRPETSPWPLSALAGADLAADLKALGEFNCRHAAEGAGAASADVVELNATSMKSIDAAMKIMPRYLQAYIEIPIHRDPGKLIATIARRGARAKVRTGGVTPDAFPAADDLARFIHACIRANVPFKATAGLHHPLRAEYQLTYAPDSGSGTMFGFLNVFLAAAFTLAGMEEREVIALLEERSPDAFRFDQTGIEWSGHRIGLDVISNARERALISFGSCSFTEPIGDLAAVRLL